MRVAIATAILGAVLVASPTSQTSSSRPSDSLERPFAQNGTIRTDLSAGAYRISGSKDNRIQIAWSVRDASALSRVRARADVRGRDASIATEGPNNQNLHFCTRRRPT